MIGKQIIEDILQNKVDSSFESLRIDYNGFDGHGINGVSSKTIYIKDINDEEEHRLVNSYGSDERTKVNLIELELNDDYILAKYNIYIRRKYSDDYYFNRSYTMIIPYESITSMCIGKIEK